MRTLLISAVCLLAGLLPQDDSSAHPERFERLARPGDLATPVEGETVSVETPGPSGSR